MITNKTKVAVPILTVDDSLSVDQRLSDNARQNILPARYLQKDDDGNVAETPEQLFHRVADNVATAEYLYSPEEFEEWSERFEELMGTLQFMPNSPTLMNAGMSLQQLSACFVLEPGDSLIKPDEFGRDSIMDTAHNAAAVFKSGGGVGYSFSHLRPKGTWITSTESETSGPMQFMELFDATCQTVKQGGKRRGAQMGIMRVDHPDIGRFAVAKREEGNLSNFNISVAITDEFKRAVDNDDTYTFYSPQSDFSEEFEYVNATKHFYSPEYKNASPGVVDENIWRDHVDGMEAWDWDEGTTVSFREKWQSVFEDMDFTGTMELPARFIWDIVLDGAWRNGEPGLFHIDETNREHTFDVEKYPEYKIHATNPCAEQPLVRYEACNLGHINLGLMLQPGAMQFSDWLDEYGDGYYREESQVVDYMNQVIDYDRLDYVIEGGVRFLDNVVTMSEFPVEQITNQVNDLRKIGLGVMGWAHMLLQMGIDYGSDDSITAARHIMSYIDAQATWQSHKLAEERGSFDAWDKSKYADPMSYPEWFEKHTQQDPTAWKDGFPMRNHNVTTVAPTGTTGMIANTSGGIEPLFNVAFKKNVGNDIQGAEKLVEFDPFFMETLKANGIDVMNMKRMVLTQMNENRFEGVSSLPLPEDVKNMFTTTNEISSREHGLMQRAFQDAVDSGISKTINLPEEATHEDVHDAYMLALSDDEVGSTIKGLTVYRNNSRKIQVMMNNENTTMEIEEAKKIVENAGYAVTKEENDE